MPLQSRDRHVSELAVAQQLQDESARTGGQIFLQADRSKGYRTSKGELGIVAGDKARSSTLPDVESRSDKQRWNRQRCRSVLLRSGRQPGVKNGCSGFRRAVGR